MARSAFPGRLAFFDETTQGTGPTDAADWNTNGSPVNHLEADPASIRRPRIANENMVERIYTVNEMIDGIENTEFTTRHYLTGPGSVTADTSQIADNDEFRLFEYSMGAVNRSTSTTCTGGTASDPILDAVTGIDEGIFIGFEDLDDPGKVYIRRVLVLAGNTVTLDEDLPFTPVNGDLAHATGQAYPDPEALVDSADPNYRTFSWLIDKTRDVGDADDIWEMNGCKGSLSFDSFDRNGLPAFILSHLSGSFQEDHIEGPTWTSTPESVMGAPLAIGPDTTIFFQDVGTSTQNSIPVVSASVEPGIPVISVDTITSLNANMPGRDSYTTNPADTTVEFATLYDSSIKDDLDAGTFKKFRLARVAAAGQCWAIHMSRCEQMEDPERGEANGNTTSITRLRAHEDLDNSNASNANLWKAKISIVFC